MRGKCSCTPTGVSRAFLQLADVGMAVLLALTLERVRGSSGEAHGYLGAERLTLQ